MTQQTPEVKPQQEEKKSNNSAIIIAVIGALATVLTACLTGFFGLMQFSVGKILEPTSAGAVVAPPPTQVKVPVSATVLFTPPATAAAEPSTTPAPTFTPTSTVQPSPTVSPGLLFASKISTDGKAVDPGSTFQRGITELYAVFPASDPPPGIVINVTDPEAGAYYAFLRVPTSGNLASFGWQWVYQGEVLNDYQVDVSDGADFWLAYVNNSSGGIFGGSQFGPGTYKIIITLGGNPAMSGELNIQP